jgi:hypothetical protein
VNENNDEEYCLGCASCGACKKLFIKNKSGATDTTCATCVRPARSDSPYSPTSPPQETFPCSPESPTDSPSSPEEKLDTTTTLGALLAETTSNLAQVALDDDEVLCIEIRSNGSVEDTRHKAKKQKRRREEEPESIVPEPAEHKKAKRVPRNLDLSKHTPPHLHWTKAKVVKKAFKKALKMKELWTTSSGQPKSNVTRADLESFVEWYTSNQIEMDQ